jgi:hypothetical protein
MASKASDAALRVRLWHHLLSAFDIEPSLPLSTRVANVKSAALAHAAARTLAKQQQPEEEADSHSLPAGAWKRAKAIFTKQPPDFGAVVIAQADRIARAVAEAAAKGGVAAADQAELAEKVRAQIEDLPPELRSEAMEEALRSGDTALIGLLASGTSLLGVGIAVKLAGFSAYILAAQAAAVIPFVGGSTAVSALFVLANPLFIGPMIVVGAYLAGEHVRATQKRLSANVTVLLALRGIAFGADGLRTTLDGFKSLSPADLIPLPEKARSSIVAKLSNVRGSVGSPLPPTPWSPKGRLATPLTEETDSVLQQILSSRNREDVREALIVGGVTVGDVLYDAAAIDPTVLSAADFSRAEEICSVFDFCAFSDRFRSAAAESVAGAESNLRGYVAEQIVAARLVEQGHVVSFPTTPNNPGFDLLVDGCEYQVKCLEGVAGLYKHFGTYPDVPVFANSELAEQVSAIAERWAEKVFFIEGFSREATEFIMQSALDAGVSLDDVDAPYFAAAVSAARNLLGWWHGRVPLADLPFSVVLDGAVKGGLAAVGGISGKVLGLLLFGPAGALIFGGVGGAGAVLGSRWTREQATRLISEEWVASLDAATDQLHRALIQANQRKMSLLREKRSRLAEQNHEQKAWFVARMSDEILAVAEHLYELENDTGSRGQPERARACLQWMGEANVHPSAVQQELSELLCALSQREPLVKAVSRKARFGWEALKRMPVRRS